MSLVCALAVLGAAGAQGQVAALSPTLDEMREIFAGHGSRAPGMAGNEWLEAHVAARFADSGFTNGAIHFSAPVFVPGQTSLALADGEVVSLLTMHPTMMRPGNFPEREFSARLVYLGRGAQADLQRLSGVDLRGAIALMEFDCGDRWLKLLRLGLSGFVFIGQDDYAYRDSVAKVYNTEVATPRFFVAAADGQRLRDACAGDVAVTVDVRSTPSTWKTVTLRDLWAIVPGAGEKVSNEVVVITAPIDANSVVPELAIGAQSAGNLDLLLKLLDGFKETPPARTVVLAAVNGHTHYYSGERALAWHLLAASGLVESMRNTIAKEMRTAQLYAENYALLGLEKPLLEEEELFAVIDVLWQLDKVQQAKREAARDAMEAERRAGLEARAATNGADEGADEASDLVTPPIDPVLDLSEFSRPDYERAIDAAAQKLRDDEEAFLTKLSTDSEAVLALAADRERIVKLKDLDAARLLELAERAKPVFDDEKLFESWRVKLDKSTGVRLPIKGELQNEVKRRLNAVKLALLDASEGRVADEEAERTLPELRAAKTNLTAVLVLFNKVDVGIGRSRTRYRSIAVDEHRLGLLAQFRDTLVDRFSAAYEQHRLRLEVDTANGALRRALGRRHVVFVVSLEIDWRADAVGFCSLDSQFPAKWQRGFGQLSVEVAAEAHQAFAGHENPFVDTMTELGGNSEEYFFPIRESAAPFFHAAEQTPAFALKSPFITAGHAFSPGDSFARLDAARIDFLQRWLIGYFDALLRHPEIASAESLRSMGEFAGREIWSVAVQTYTMDEFSGKTTPDRPIGHCLVALYETASGGPLRPIIAGDVVNVYMGQTDVTGQTVLYGLGNNGNLSSTAYRMDPSFTRVDYTIDKGRVQSSKQMTSNLNRSSSKTLPMFACREFPVYERVDPTLIGVKPITVLQYWPKVARSQADPQKYGAHGVGTLSPATSQKTVGPASVLLWDRGPGMRNDSVLLISDSQRLALNATADEPEGVGFADAADMGPAFFARAAADMDVLNRHRLKKMKGVSNELVTDFLAQGRKALEDRERALAAGDHVAAIRATYVGLGNQVKAYWEMRKMNADMLKAIVVYMGLMLPFCFFLQKLLFKFTRLEHELLAFLVLFVSTYAVFRVIHPAFAMAMNPEAIFIAFVLGAIGCFITGVLRAKFDSEMQLLFRTAPGMGEDVNYSTVGQTAMLIGVNNMKRRRVRTTLTTATIVLVVFTMLAFSSVSRKMRPSLLAKSKSAPYTGLLYHWPGRAPMDEATAWAIEDLYADRAELSVRRVLLPPDAIGQAEIVPKWRLSSLAAESRHLDVEALMGLTMADQTALGGIPLIAGRYFTAADAHEALLPAAAAEALRIKPADVGRARVSILGETFLVVGIVDDERYMGLRDLNPNRPLVPQKWKKGEALTTTEAEKVEEDSAGTALVGMDALLLVPAERLAAMGGAPFSISVRFPETKAGEAIGDIWEAASVFTTITKARFYLGSRHPFKAGADARQDTPAGVYYVGSSYRTSIGGLSRLLIPLLIAGSIILNTMLGTVYERKSEIAVYNAIGLNPTHIFMFFLAEAFVYSVIGAVGGYLIGQVLAITCQKFELVSGVNINFSSLMVVYAILFTIALVLLSTIYPGIVATRSAVPSGKRKWSLPAHDGNHIPVVFPFIYQPGLVPGVMYYIYEYFARFTEQSLGDQVAALQDWSHGADDAGRPTYTLIYGVALAPFDLGVTQTATFTARYEEVVDSYRITMDVERVSGQDSNWTTTNKPFLEKLRKLLIRWRNIDPTLHKLYVERGERLFRDGPSAELDAEPVRAPVAAVADDADAPTDALAGAQESS